MYIVSQGKFVVYGIPEARINEFKSKQASAAFM